MLEWEWGKCARLSSMDLVKQATEHAGGKCTGVPYTLKDLEPVNY